MRWVDGYQRVNELADQLPDTRLTYVADREAEIYDLFVEAPCPELAADWLVRGQHDRVLADGRTLRQHLDTTSVLAATTFERPPPTVARPEWSTNRSRRYVSHSRPGPHPPRRRGHGPSRH